MKNETETKTKKSLIMKTIRTLLAAGLLMTWAVGCSSTGEKESMLSAAGFKMVPANTPERQARLKLLPADEITPVQRDGVNYYTFPDPKQNVLYVGQEQQFQEYQRLRLQKQMADEELNAAQMN